MTGENDDFFREITTGMASGDETAYRRFYEACFDKLFRHLLVKTRGNDALARDLAQIVLLRVVRYVKPFSGERVFWAWLIQLCRSAHVDWLRANSKPLPENFADLSQEQSAVTDEVDEELLQHLEGAITLLESQERQLLQLAYFDTVPQRKIAEQLQTTPKAVESKLGRIRQKLRRTLMERLKEYVVF